MAPFRSFGWPIRPAGVRAMICLLKWSMTGFESFVGKNPGAIALTWILCGASFTARSFVKVMTAPLLVL